MEADGENRLPNRSSNGFGDAAVLAGVPFWRVGMNNELNAAQQPVAWQRKYLGATRDGRPVDWHNITMEEFEQTKQGKWASKYEVRELYATPVAAAPTAPLKVFSKGQWIFRETRQEFRGADLDEAAFAEYRKFSTPAAPGIDLRNAILQLREDALHMKDPGDTVNAYNRVLALIDASQNGELPGNSGELER